MKPGISKPFEPLSAAGQGQGVPKNFPDLIVRAAEEGHAFAAAYCVLPESELRTQSKKREKRMAHMANGIYPITRALEGVFHYAAITDNMSKDDGLGDRRLCAALSAAAQAQQSLMKAFMALPPKAIRLVLRAERTEFNLSDWRKTCAGALAAARVARAICDEGLPCGTPHVEVDIHQKVDLVCGPFPPSSYGFCLQIKGLQNKNGSRWHELTGKPDGYASKHSAQVVSDTLKGHASFNRTFGKDWTPVLVEVGLTEGTLEDVTSCPTLRSLVRTFFASKGFIQA